MNPDLCPEKTVEGDGELVVGTADVSVTGDTAVVTFDLEGTVLVATLARESAAAD